MTRIALCLCVLTLNGFIHFMQLFFLSDSLAFMNVNKKICLLLALGHTDSADFLHPSSWFSSHLPTSSPA